MPLDPKMYEPLRRIHLDKIYPLSRFRAFLSERVSPGTAAPFVSSIRRLLHTLGEGRPDAQGQIRSKVWLNAPAVAEYLAALPRNTRSVARCAFDHWLFFTKAPPGNYVAARTSKAEASCAFRLLLNFRGAGFPRLPLEELAAARWARSRHDPEVLLLVPSSGGFDEGWQLAPGLKEMADIVRAWCKCGVGDPLLPVHPNSKVPMSREQVRAFIKIQVPVLVETRLQALLRKADKEALTQFGLEGTYSRLVPASELDFHLPPAGVWKPDDDSAMGYVVIKQESQGKQKQAPSVVRGEGFTVVGHGPSARVIYDRDPEYEDYVVPADEPSDAEPEDSTPE